MRRTVATLILFLGVTLFAQQTDAQRELLKKVNENDELLNANPKQAFEASEEFEKLALRINAREAELKTINTKCRYYRINNDFENMMSEAKTLYLKSVQYDFPIYQLIAKRFLFESYLFAGLPEKAIVELEQGRELLNKLNDADSLNIIERANFFVAYSNYYLLKEDYQNQLKYINLSGKELKKLGGSDYNQKYLYVHYSNLASSYSKNNEKDSAKHYAKLSLTKGKRYNLHQATFNNLVILGDVGMEELNYEESLYFFMEAEKLDGYKNHLDLEELYDNIIEANKKMGRSDFVSLYRAKKDSLKLSISENQNKSLHKLLSERKESKMGWFVYILLIFIVVLLVFSFYIIRKNRILAHQEKISDQYLDKISKNPSGEDYSNLLRVLKENTSAFMFYFEEVFPEFSLKLSSINSEISSSEIEFCALLKLKIPTKDIAKYKFVEPKTVRNWKYLIRKKLDIPKEVDIYQWFETL